MSFLTELPTGNYPVEIGRSVTEAKPKKEVLTIRYDFMPASIDQNDKYVVQDAETDDQIAVVVPKLDQGTVSVKDSTIFKGQKKRCKGKDCILLYNHDTQEFSLEMVSSMITLKQSRGDTTQLTEAVQKYIDLKKESGPSLEDDSDAASDDDLMSSSSNNNHSSDSEDDVGGDPLEEALNAAKAAALPASTPAGEKKKQPVSQLHSDLHLSDSSDEDT